jgi:hypothetical protein
VNGIHEVGGSIPPGSTSLPPLDNGMRRRRRNELELPPVRVPALDTGALAVGAFALGALAIGALAIGPARDRPRHGAEALSRRGRHRRPNGPAAARHRRRARARQAGRRHLTSALLAADDAYGQIRSPCRADPLRHVLTVSARRDQHRIVRRSDGNGVGKCPQGPIHTAAVVRVAAGLGIDVPDHCAAA